MKITPMFEQYLRLKQEHPDALLLFRLGDFYELFFEDAERAARLLDITLTTRSKKDEVPIPMCGVPYHALQPYVAKLLASGCKVAVCDQMEDPSVAKGLVARAVVRVITPGTVTEEEYLDPKEPNYLAALQPDASEVAVVSVDLSTGELRQAVARSEDAALDVLSRLTPREVLLPAGADALAAAVRRALPNAMISPVPPERFDTAAGRAWLRTAASDGNGDASPIAAAALGALLWYLGQTHRASLAHLRPPQTDDAHGVMLLDEATRRNLELLTTTRGERRGSLLGVLDRTATPMGGRLLRQWLLAPLTDLGGIGDRLDAVEELLGQTDRREALGRRLGTIGDLERLSARLAAARVTPRDLLGLAAALAGVSEVRAVLAESRATALRAAAAALDDLPHVRQRIAATLTDAPPLQPRAGGLIRAGFDPRVDELRDLAHRGKRFISELETRERARTGIGSLKVRYNQVFGYYIEVTKPNLHLVPPDYRRKQTLANAERFTTAELEEHEAKVLGAQERLAELEAALFDELVAAVAAEHPALARTAAALAEDEGQQPGSVFVPIHWSGRTSRQARVGALIPARLDPFSGQPEFKHAAVRVERVEAAWYGFALSRRPLRLPGADYWTVVQGRGHMRLELAGLRPVPDWSAWARRLLGAPGRGHGAWIEYADSASFRYRGALLRDGRLEGCVFIAPHPRLPPRAWLGELIAGGGLDPAQRGALLTGAPGNGHAPGRLVCSCFGVEAARIVEAARNNRLRQARDVGAALKAGTNCGSCIPEIQALLDGLEGEPAPQEPFRTP